MIMIDIMEVLLQRLKKSGWKQNGGYAILGNPRVLDRSLSRIAVVKPIKINPYKILQEEIDKFFHSLIGIVIKNGIKHIFLPGGGDIHIPQFFFDFCRDQGINYNIVNSDNIDVYENF